MIHDNDKAIRTKGFCGPLSVSGGIYLVALVRKKKYPPIFQSALWSALLIIVIPCVPYLAVSLSRNDLKNSG